MDIKKEIEIFEPFDELEAYEKEYTLKFIETHNDYLTRDNIFGHITASAFVVNENHDKILLVHQLINNGWMYPGGHADGNSNLLEVAIREVEEETGISVKVLDEHIFAMQNGVVRNHEKNGVHVHFHTHFDIMYLFEANENDVLRIKKDENSGVKWFSFADACGEEIVPLARPIHDKVIKKLKKLEGRS